MVRIGTDIVEVKRINRLIQRHSDHFTQQFFSETEINFCEKQTETGAWIARLWSAREAVFKIFGTGNYWQDLQFTPRPTGKLEITFTNDSFHNQSSIPRNANWDVSTDHNQTRAVSVAVCRWTPVEP